MKNEVQVKPAPVRKIFTFFLKNVKLSVVTDTACKIGDIAE